MELAGATWTEVDATARRGLLVLPVGSLEQHGPHLPLDTDSRVAVALAHGLADRLPDVVVAPVVPYGASGEHAGFPGTLSLNHQVLGDLVIELVRSARAAFMGVVVLSGHGGNAEGLARAEARCVADGEPVLFWFARSDGGDAHAGRTETSLMLAIDPSVVRLDQAQAGCTEPLGILLARLRAEGVRPVSSNGVLGDPTGATAAEGRTLLDSMTADLVSAVAARWSFEATVS
jgi:creatinine amidohydrolase